MSDEPRKLDLIQRYAERLGEEETTVAEFMAPANSENVARISTHKSLDAVVPIATSHPPRAASDVPRSHPPMASQRTPISPASVEIDFDRLERLGCIRPDGDKKTPLVEQFQIIKRPLIQKASAVGRSAVRNGNTILVTSAQPGEGKSFVAINLAMSIASEQDLSVLLLDSDHYNQTLPSMLGIKTEAGLIDLLLDDSLDVADVLLQTNVPNLTILPSGRRNARGTELLSSQRMTRLIRDLVSGYPNRIIVIDAPPVLASTETGILASHVGQIVMVVEQNRTGWRLVERSLARLSDCLDISFVLNKVEPLWDENFGASYR